VTARWLRRRRLRQQALELQSPVRVQRPQVLALQERVSPVVLAAFPVVRAVRVVRAAQLLARVVQLPVRVACVRVPVAQPQVQAAADLICTA
jgi:hypothetical protein